MDARDAISVLGRRSPSDSRLRAPSDDFADDERWRARLSIQQKSPKIDKREAALAHADLMALFSTTRPAPALRYSTAVVNSLRDDTASVPPQKHTTASSTRSHAPRIARRTKRRSQERRTCGSLLTTMQQWVGRSERAPHSGQMFSVMFADPIEQFLTTDDGHRVTVAWVPGHEDL
ncbi:hypothetical protein EXIGLDRAFT_840493 [Exidia glandulosa HHB12029]|uniref:Uncharacterized protein n=1 Tax=Exidia glandulosa HHB12029 TaxID=1314781 RepID=A0A165ZY77_EXIGL|nr:hypothetical protein EXIGLDRAFT_840493 [Exidia glandulosa HHB12029]